MVGLTVSRRRGMPPRLSITRRIFGGFAAYISGAGTLRRMYWNRCRHRCRCTPTRRCRRMVHVAVRSARCIGWIVGSFPDRGRAAPCPPEQIAALAAPAADSGFSNSSCPTVLPLPPDGVRLGARWTPISAAGIYVPGGTAAYPSSVLMNAIPAAVAGVPRVVMAVPTPDGETNPLVLAAAHLAGVTEIYRIGGAQAVAALAFGTDTIAPVDKITGRGMRSGRSKTAGFGTVGIDMIAGHRKFLLSRTRKMIRHGLLPICCLRRNTIRRPNRC